MSPDNNNNKKGKEMNGILHELIFFTVKMRVVKFAWADYYTSDVPYEATSLYEGSTNFTTFLYVFESLFKDCSNGAITKTSTSDSLIESSIFVFCTSKQNGGAINLKNKNNIIAFVCGNSCNASVYANFGIFLYFETAQNNVIMQLMTSICFCSNSNVHATCDMRNGMLCIKSANVTNNTAYSSCSFRCASSPNTGNATNAISSACFIKEQTVDNEISYCTITNNEAIMQACIYLLYSLIDDLTQINTLRNSNIISNIVSRTHVLGLISIQRNSRVEHCCLLYNIAMYQFSVASEYVNLYTLTITDCTIDAMNQTIAYECITENATCIESFVMRLGHAVAWDGPCDAFNVSNFPPTKCMCQTHNAFKPFMRLFLYTNSIILFINS